MPAHVYRMLFAPTHASAKPRGCVPTTRTAPPPETASPRPRAKMATTSGSEGPAAAPPRMTPHNLAAANCVSSLHSTPCVQFRGYNVPAHSILQPHTVSQDSGKSQKVRRGPRSNLDAQQQQKTAHMHKPPPTPPERIQPRCVCSCTDRQACDNTVDVLIGLPERACRVCRRHTLQQEEHAPLQCGQKHKKDCMIGGTHPSRAPARARGSASTLPGRRRRPWSPHTCETVRPAGHTSPPEPPPRATRLPLLLLLSPNLAPASAHSSKDFDQFNPGTRVSGTRHRLSTPATLHTYQH